MIDCGTLTISMVITMPGFNNTRSKTKHVALARYHHVTLDQAHELKDVFIKTNDELVAEFISAKWECRQYL